MGDYYSIERLRTMKDINGQVPELFIVDGNRTAGKSFSIKSMLVDTFLKKKDINQFFYLYRYKTDMQNCSEQFFGDLEERYNGYVMTEKKLFDGAVIQLFLNNKLCGFCLPLSLSTKIKRFSSIFSQVRHGFFDEYQDENNNYLEDEIGKLMSIHTSIARGHSKQHRYVPLYMASNTVSVLNPYYSTLGITKRLKDNTKFLKGNGWVFERTYNTSAKKAFEESGFNKAFSANKYYQFASENVYLNDNLSLIEKPTGVSVYLLTVKYNGEYYNIRRYSNVVYVSEGCDATFPTRVCFNVNDVVDDRNIMITRNNYNVVFLRNYFSRGCMRFENIKCKNMTFDLLSYV